MALIDVDRPSSRFVRVAHSLYFDRVVPVVGGMLSDRAAYAYLPKSTAYLPEAPVLESWLVAAGFDDVHSKTALLGSAQLWWARC